MDDKGIGKLKFVICFLLWIKYQRDVFSLMADFDYLNIHILCLFYSIRDIQISHNVSWTIYNVHE